MLNESLAVFICTLLLGLMGVGPALWLIQGENRVKYAFAIAPALGYALLVIVAFPIVRFVAPVRSWAWPLTLVWIAGSVGLAGLDWRKHPEAYRQQFRCTPSMAAVAVTLVAGLILVSPLLLKGIQYAVFRSNPSDAFVYMSFADTLRLAPWPVELGGVAMRASNLVGLQNLGTQAPTALFTARLLEMPLIINKMATLGWAAEITRLPVIRLYYADHLLSYLLTVPLVLAMGDKLKLPRVLQLLAAGAVAVGFWARFVLETDAGYEISVIPVLLLFVLAWMQLVETSGRGPVSREHLLLGVAGAAIVVSYPPSVALSGLAVIIYEAVALIQFGPRPRAWLGYVVAAGIVLLVLTLTGQIDFVVRGTLNLIGRAGDEAKYAPIVLQVLKRDGVAGLWGLPGTVVAGINSGSLRWLVQATFQAMGVALSGMWLLTGLQNMKRSAPKAERIIFCMIGAGLIMALASYAVDNHRSAGKAISYIYPYLTLSAVLFARYAPLVFQPAARQLSLVFLGAWLSLQTVLGLYLPYLPIVPGETLSPVSGEVTSIEHGLWAYDVRPITDYLALHPPRRLAVYVPRDTSLPYAQSWLMAGYAMFVFERYPVYFQSGFITDNSPTTPSVWPPPLTEQPDYEVILKSADYLGPESLGELVAQTSNLALYRLKPDSLASLNLHEQRLKAIEAPLLP